MMTREEAIEYIKEWLKDEYALSFNDKEVLNIAVEALKREVNYIKELEMALLD